MSILSAPIPVCILLMVVLSNTNNTLAAAQQELRVVPSVDLSRYAGTWYEIARLPNRFQKSCAGEVTATYTIREDGQIDLLNRCRQANGGMKGAAGVARLASPSGPNSKLKVRFAPAFLSFLPMVWGDYWIIDLAPDYSHAVVGDPSRKYLWILCRTPQMDEERYTEVLDKVRQQGFEVGQLLRTRQER